MPHLYYFPTGQANGAPLRFGVQVLQVGYLGGAVGLLLDETPVNFFLGKGLPVEPAIVDDLVHLVQPH